MEATKKEIDKAFEFFKAADTIISMSSINYYIEGRELVLKCLMEIKEI